MNHTTVGTIFAISMVAALMIVAVSIVSSPKALAASMKLGDLPISVGTSDGKASLTGPLGLSISTDNSTSTSNTRPVS